MMTLRPYQASDAAEIVRWIGDERAFRQWCADRYETYPITADDMNRHYAGMPEQQKVYLLTAVDESDIVGHLMLRLPDAAEPVWRVGFVIVSDKKRGRGYGKQMLTLAVQYAFEVLHAEKVTLGVFANNEPALHCYESVGFRLADTAEPEYYPVFGENWKCMEMELSRSGQ